MRLARDLFVTLVAGFLIGLATTLYARSPVLGLVVGLIATLAVGLIVRVARIEAVRSRIPIVSIYRRRGPPQVELTVSGGPSADVRISVRNIGLTADFHATANLVASRNDPNRVRIGNYAVPWLGHSESLITLIRNQSHPLLVARWQGLTFPDPPPITRMGQVDIMEWNGSAEAMWDTFRWLFDPNGKLPEYDLDIRLFSTVASEPLALKYILRPSHWTGPLELVPRA
jgi:hypothetical protein